MTIRASVPPPPSHSGNARCRIICGVRDHPWPSHPPSQPQRWIRVPVIWLSGDTCQLWDVWREESAWIRNSWLIQAIWLLGLLLHFPTKPQSHRNADGVLVWPQTHRGGPMCGPVGFLDITSLTLPPQCTPSLGFLSHCSMGKTHIFITAGPSALYNLSLLSSSPPHRRVNHRSAVKLDMSQN